MDLFRIGQVVDNKDPDKLGRVKTRIYPEFDTLEEDSLPWVEPMNEDDICIPSDSTGVGSFRIPEIDSFIIVEIDSTWQEFHYSGLTPNRKRTDIHTNIADKLSEYIDGVGVEYPQPLYLLRTKDGAIAYHNTDTGELGIVNKNGVYLRYDSDGNFEMGSKDGSKIKLGTDGSLNFSGHTNGDSSLVLYEPLKEILEKLLDHIHVAPNGPTTSAQESNGTPLSSLKGDLEKMVSK